MSESNPSAFITIKARHQVRQTEITYILQQPNEKVKGDPDIHI
jgi:hypothetical protein